jgi:hypothetical protein
MITNTTADVHFMPDLAFGLQVNVTSKSKHHYLEKKKAANNNKE